MSSSVRVFSWSPATGSNFGDVIGPEIVERLGLMNGVELQARPVGSGTRGKLLAVGSILHEARNGDVVWGAGVNGKIWASQLALHDEVLMYAVRGPVTADCIRSYGFEDLDVFGDPGLLYPMLFDREIRREHATLKRRFADNGLEMPRIVYVPNINDERFDPKFLEGVTDEVFHLSPSLSPVTVAAYIYGCTKVLTSSLHGLVFGEAMHREVTLIDSKFEPALKYIDYFEGTGRNLPTSVRTVREAIDGVTTPTLTWTPQRLVDSFPLIGPSVQQCKSLFTRDFRVPSDEPVEVSQLANTTPFSASWSEPSDGSVWTLGKSARMTLDVADLGYAPRCLRLTVGTLPKGEKHYEKVRFMAKGQVIHTHEIIRGNAAMIAEVPITPECISGGMLELDLRIENPTRPADHFLGRDSRQLGIWVSKFQVLS